MKKNTPSKRPRESGVVLLFSLIVLVVLLAGGVAVMRSMNSSLFSAGNLAFKRDLVNQGELAVSNVLTAFATGALAAATATADSVPAANYSAVQLQANPRGIPLVLLDNQTPHTGPDILGATFTPGITAVAGATPDISIRYVIDRLCNNAGSAAALGEAGCVRQPSATEVRGGTAGAAPLPKAPSLIYRLTVRVDGPRETQVFLQTSFAKPE